MDDRHIPLSQVQKIIKPPLDHDHDDEDDELEALSLCDFPMINSDADKPKIIIQDKRRSSSEPSDFFEFFNVNTTTFEQHMSHAEDIIFRGKLVPCYKNQHHQILKSHSTDDASRRYRESLAPPDNAGYVGPTNTIGSTNSLNRRYKKLRRNSGLLTNSGATDIHRSSSRSSAKSDQGWGRNISATKPRWFVLMFGPLKAVVRPEMDLQDMKSRQVRRNIPSMFPAADGGGGKAPAGRRGSSWGHDLLRVLSCKSDASVAVTASIGLVPHF